MVFYNKKTTGNEKFGLFRPGYVLSWQNAADEFIIKG